MSKHNFLFLCTLSLMALPLTAAPRRVHTIGDSTMSDYKPAATPKRGWGMYLQAFFNPDSVTVNNRGKSGASTRTFYETENLWPSVKSQMHEGDYLIIQFAHNDEKCKGEDVYVRNAQLRAEGKDTLTDMRGTEPNTTYKEYLFRFINEAREMGVTPILMSPICRAYFGKDGKINDEGRHKLPGTKELTNTEAAKVLAPAGTRDKDYVRCMRDVAEAMAVPFLDMTKRTQEYFEYVGKDKCMAEYFNCGDKTHTSATGGMVVAMQANLLLQWSDLEELKSWMVTPTMDELYAYSKRIEESGKKAAFAAKGTPFETVIENNELHLTNMELDKKGYTPVGGAWPAGEIDEVANRYIEYTIAAEKKKGMVIETINLDVKAKGGDGMNIHINYGFGSDFNGVTTIYENTALPKCKTVNIHLDQPILVPAGQTLHIRILPWYDSNGKPQSKKYLQLKGLVVTGKRLM